MKSHTSYEADAIRAAIVTAARAHVGTRFRHQGRAPGLGLDCVGLVAVADARVGDVALMRFTRAARHVGILTGGTLIHAWMQAGRVVEHRLDASWRARMVEAFSFPGVN